jgi:hypothetical protein
VQQSLPRLAVQAIQLCLLPSQVVAGFSAHTCTFNGSQVDGELANVEIRKGIILKRI